MRRARPFLGLVLACLSVTAASTASHQAVRARMVLTAGCYYHKPAVLTADDLIVMQGYKPLPTIALTPLRGVRADLKLYVLVDNSSNYEVGSRFEDLRNFFGSQPPTTSIGVAYIQDRNLLVAQKPTNDRSRAMAALNPPSGSKPANPFEPLADLIRHMDQDSSRRVVLMVSNGIDPATTGGSNASVEAVIEAAQRAGVTVYAIYHPSADYLTMDYSQSYLGQVQLAHLANETGGGAYFQGLEALPSFAPFLASIADHLANQYLVEFLTTDVTPGTLQNVSVTSKIQDVYLMVPWRVWVPQPRSVQSNAGATGHQSAVPRASACFCRQLKHTGKTN